MKSLLAALGRLIDRSDATDICILIFVTLFGLAVLVSAIRAV